MDLEFKLKAADNGGRRRRRKDTAKYTGTNKGSKNLSQKGQGVANQSETSVDAHVKFRLIDVSMFVFSRLEASSSQQPATGKLAV